MTDAYYDLAYAIGSVLTYAGVVPSTTLAEAYDADSPATLLLTANTDFTAETRLTIWDDQREARQQKVVEQIDGGVTVAYTPPATAMVNEHASGALVGANILIGRPAITPQGMFLGRSLIHIWPRVADTNQFQSRRDEVEVIMRVQVHRRLLLDPQADIDPELWNADQEQVADGVLLAIRQALAASPNLVDDLGPHSNGYIQPAFREANDLVVGDIAAVPQWVEGIDVWCHTRYTRQEMI